MSQHPAASYIASLKVPTSTLSPYDQYGFEPAASNYEALQSKYFESVATTRSPLKNSESEDLDGRTASSNKAESTQNKGQYPIIINIINCPLCHFMCAMRLIISVILLLFLVYSFLILCLPTFFSGKTQTWCTFFRHIGVVWSLKM